MESSTNKKAIYSLTLGILSVVIPYLGMIFGIIGIVISFISLNEIKKSNQQGKGLAIAGKVCSIKKTPRITVFF
jgi:hypothetical protein